MAFSPHKSGAPESTNPAHFGSLFFLSFFPSESHSSFSFSLYLCSLSQFSSLLLLFSPSSSLTSVMPTKVSGKKERRRFLFGFTFRMRSRTCSLINSYRSHPMLLQASLDTTASQMKDVWSWGMTADQCMLRVSFFSDELPDTLLRQTDTIWSQLFISFCTKVRSSHETSKSHRSF